MPENMLVIGADAGSLGSYIMTNAMLDGWTVDWTQMHWSGPRFQEASSPYVGEGFIVNVTEPQWWEPLDFSRYTAIVYAAGVNVQSRVATSVFLEDLIESLHVNFYGAMEAIYRWHLTTDLPGSSFVVIGSNSALIPRSESLAYCTSKAALHMGVKCFARDIRRLGSNLNLYGYDPCWLEGTNMSRAVSDRLGEDVPRHRVPGGNGLDAYGFGQFVVDQLEHSNKLHGSMLRVDLGDT